MAGFASMSEAERARLTARPPGPPRPPERVRRTARLLAVAARVAVNFPLVSPTRVARAAAELLGEEFATLDLVGVARAVRAMRDATWPERHRDHAPREAWSAVDGVSTRGLAAARGHYRPRGDGDEVAMALRLIAGSGEAD